MNDEKYPFAAPMTRAVSLTALACALAVMPGCFDNVETEFPTGLEPFELPNAAEAPAPEASEAFPERLVFERRRYRGGLSIHAKAYVQADIATTFDAVRNPLAGADRRPDVTFTYEEGVEPEYAWSHRSHLVIPDIVTVELQLTWRSGVVEGTEDAPFVTSTRWQKTWGTSAISRLEGSVVCYEVEPGVTELHIQYHLDALSQGYETIEDYLQGYYDSILALVRGEPLPEQM